MLHGIQGTGVAWKKIDFSRAFEKATKKTKGSNIRLPEFELQEIEDYYVWYVEIMGISEDIFWNGDIHMVEMIARNKGAYENWKNYAQEKVIENG